MENLFKIGDIVQNLKTKDLLVLHLTKKMIYLEQRLKVEMQDKIS